MGILNITPDSFSDGGRFRARDAALRHAEQMLAAGAAILDIGGESTRPGATLVTADEELDRVLPVLEALQGLTDVPVSVDTSKPGVMRAAAAAGAALINDVYALRAKNAVETVAESGLAVCLMHMQGEPRTMQVAPRYGNVTVEVAEFLKARLACCLEAGIARNQILLDPGFGFGKSHAHNMQLLYELQQLASLGQVLVAGWSRKATLGFITGKGVNERVSASVAAAVIAVLQGAAIIRAHDVAETVDAVRVAGAFLNAGRMA
ncbi:MAG TPA: dihydropteroate synthase [Woeseiaceae bacterium]|nr:dihydropteroate synthase [Woeseiaceae bacterium]